MTPRSTATLCRTSLMVVLATACAPDEQGPGVVPTTCPIAAGPTEAGGIPAPTFAAHILPALQSSCGSQSTTCHGALPGEPPKGKVDFSTGAGRTAADVHADLVNVAPSNAPMDYMLVKPNDLAHSWIYEKVTQDNPGVVGFGARMPFGLPNLCKATTDTLAAWITQGAAP